jgi:hypothetical protein
MDLWFDEIPSKKKEENAQESSHKKSDRKFDPS